MAITLTADYKEVLAPEIVETIDNLMEDGHELSDLLGVYDYFGEDYAENLQEIVKTIEDTDATNSELYDFVDEFGVDNLEYFAMYKDLRDDYDSAAVDAFISLYDVSDLENFEDNYRGQFDSRREFIEDIMEAGDHNIPNWIHIDYDSTWECELRHDFDEEDGYYFTK